MNLFPPPGGPVWLPCVLRRITQGLAEQWDSPVKLKRLATASLPAAADWEGGIVYDSTALTVKYSNGTAWGAVSSSPFPSVTGLAGAIGPAIADYFSSTLSLDAGSTYEITCFAYFLKTTADTVTFTWAFSSAPVMASSFYKGTPATGFTTSTITGAPVTGEAHVQAATTMAHAATASLTTAVYHVYQFTVTVRTNLATTVQLRATEGSGTITPQAGSYMRARKII